MPISKCVKKLIDASGGKINASDAETLLKDADRLAKKIQSKEGVSSDIAVEKAVASRIKDVKKSLEKQKQNKLKNIVILENTLNKLQNRKDGGLSMMNSIKSLLFGTANNFEGVRNSIDLKQDSVTAGYTGRFIRDLQEKNLFKVFASGKFSNEIATDLWALSLNAKDKRVFSGSQEAREIAEIVHKMFDDMKNRMNKAGADIDDIQGFIVSQTHDSDKMFNRGKQEWIDFIKPKLDLDKSFEGNYDDIDTALGKAFEAIVTGIRKTSPEPKDAKLFQFEGVGNLAKKLSQKRKLIFKSADDFMAYNSEYGMRTLNEAITSAVNKQSRDLVLLEDYGTNPKGMLTEAVKRFKENNRETLATTNETINQTLIDTAIDLITGTPDASASPKLTNAVNNIKAFNMLRLMGGTALSSITNVATKAIAYQYNGKSLLGSFGQYFKDSAEFALKTNEEKMHYANLTGVYTEHYLGALNGKFADSKTFGSKASKAVRMFMKINGMEWLDSVDKISMGMTLAHDLGLQKNLTFDALDTDTQRNFKLMDITPQDWDIMRQSSRTLDENGRDYIFADDIANNALGDKLRAYYIDSVRYAIPEQTTSTKARLAFGTRRGTPMGEFLQLAMQFKSFSVALAERTWGRALYQKGKPDIAMMAQLVLSTTAMGYIAMTAKDFAKGRTARDPFDPKTIFASLVQGGGLGILGDVFFTQEGSQGRGLLGIAAGPTFGVIQDINDIYKTAISGGDASAQALRTATSLIPGQNLFYLKIPINQVMIYPLQEFLNPGSLDRMKRNIEKDNNQKFWVDPKW